MRNRFATLRLANISLVTRTLIVLLVALISFSAPLTTTAQTLRGTSFISETGDHTVEWNENWLASLTAEDEFSTMVMLEGQIMIYAVMFIHDDGLGLTSRAVYHSLSGVLMSSFDSEPSESIEWEGDDGSYRGAHILPLSGIDFLIFLRVDPNTGGTGPIMQFAAAPMRAFPVSLEAMQSELLVDGGPVFEGDDGEEVMARLEPNGETLADAPPDGIEVEMPVPARSASDSSSEDARSHDPRSRLQRDPHLVGEQQPGDPNPKYVSESNGYTVSYPDSWTDMSITDSTIGEFSLASEQGRTVVSFTGRSTTETNRQAFFEDIEARESRYPGYVDSVISDDRLLIATWTADNELAILEYVFVDDSTVVTIMVTITSGNPERYIDDAREIELNGDPILRDWEELWPEED